MTRKTSMFDVFAGLLFLAMFLVVLAVAYCLKSDKPKLAPPDPLPSIVERSK